VLGATLCARDETALAGVVTDCSADFVSAAVAGLAGSVDAALCANAGLASAIITAILSTVGIAKSSIKPLRLRRGAIGLAVIADVNVNARGWGRGFLVEKSTRTPGQKFRAMVLI
jgi:hypothetical protein